MESVNRTVTLEFEYTGRQLPLTGFDRQPARGWASDKYTSRRSNFSVFYGYDDGDHRLAVTNDASFGPLLPWF